MELISLLVHFIFLLFKISILGCFYATFFLITFKIIGNNDPEGWFAQVTSKKMKFWFKAGFLTSIFLFIFSFTYWGYHGLGAYSRIPLGYGKEMARMDFMNDSDGPDCAKYSVKDEFVCAIERVIDATDMDKKTYLVWNLRTDKVLYFDTLESYTKHATANNLPLAKYFISFDQQYLNFWYGWRFFFLA